MKTVWLTITAMVLSLAIAPDALSQPAAKSLVGVWTMGDVTAVYTREGSWIRIEKGGGILVGDWKADARRKLQVRYIPPGEEKETIIVSKVAWDGKDAVIITSETVNGKPAGLLEKWLRKKE